MQLGDYLHERLLPGMVMTACARQQIGCMTYSDDWAIRIQKGGLVKYVYGYKFDVNPNAASAVAQDKVAAYLTLTSNNIPAVTHHLVRSLHGELLRKGAVDACFKQSSAIVAKPLVGTGGRKVAKFNYPFEAVTYIQDSDEPAWSVSPWLDLAAEYRCVILDGKPALVYEKTNPVERDGLKLFNLGMGARAKTLDLNDPNIQPIISLSKKACHTMGLSLAAVDVVRTSQGQLLVLELNDGIMFENYARQSEANKKRAADVYDAIIASMVR